MPLPIKILEDFFEAKFEFSDKVAVLTRFDGFAYWQLLYFPDDSQFLKIFVDREPILSALPAVEVEGYYSDEISMHDVGDSASSLMLRPLGADKMHYVTITKTKRGRFSFSTSVGIN